MAKRNQREMEARRRRAARLFEQDYSQADVARKLGVSRVSAMRWYDRWKEEGAEGLDSTGPWGRPPRLSEDAWREVEVVLRQGPQAAGFETDLWTLGRVAEVILEVSGIDYHPGHVWRVLRGRGWSLQRPTTRARERDEERILQWRHDEWRRLKKTAPREPSSSSTKRASPKAR